tara:strand:+ start:98 stop:721 length:624 start_codon:yes stop_codon:yes gene_type:complete
MIFAPPLAVSFFLIFPDTAHEELVQSPTLILKSHTMKVLAILALCVIVAAAQSGFRINSLPLIVTTEKLCKLGDGDCEWMDVMSDPINLKVSGSADKRFLTIVASTVSTIWGDNHVQVDGGKGSNKNSSATIARIEIQTVVKEKQSDGSSELVPVYPPHATTFERAEILTMQEYDVVRIPSMIFYCIYVFLTQPIVLIYARLFLGMP